MLSGLRRNSGFRARPVRVDCAETLRQVNQSAGSNAKLVCQTACFTHVTRGIYLASYRESTQRDVSLNNSCAVASLHPMTAWEALMVAMDLAEAPHRSIRTNWCRQTAFGISLQIRLSFIPAFSQRRRHVQICSDKSNRCEIFRDATSTVTSAQPTSASIFRSFGGHELAWNSIFLARVFPTRCCRINLISIAQISSRHDVKMITQIEWAWPHELLPADVNGAANGEGHQRVGRFHRRVFADRPEHCVLLRNAIRNFTKYYVHYRTQNT